MMSSTQHKIQVIDSFDQFESYCKESSTHPENLTLDLDMVFIERLDSKQADEKTVQEFTAKILENILSLLENRSKQTPKLCKTLHIVFPSTFYLNAGQASRIYKTFKDLCDEISLSFCENSGCTDHLYELVSVLGQPGYPPLSCLDLTKAFKNNLHDEFLILLSKLLRSGICKDDFELGLSKNATDLSQKEAILLTLAELNPDNENPENELVPRK